MTCVMCADTDLAIIRLGGGLSDRESVKIENHGSRMRWQRKGLLLGEGTKRAKNGPAEDDSTKSRAQHNDSYLLQFHGKLKTCEGCGGGGRGGFGGKRQHQAFQHEAFVGRGAAQFEIGAGDEAEGAGEVAAGFVAAGPG